MSNSYWTELVTHENLFPYWNVQLLKSNFDINAKSRWGNWPAKTPRGRIARRFVAPDPLEAPRLAHSVPLHNILTFKTEPVKCSFLQMTLANRLTATLYLQILPSDKATSNKKSAKNASFKKCPYSSRLLFTHFFPLLSLLSLLPPLGSVSGKNGTR